MIKCPKCGESYFQEKYTVATALYCTPVWKNGVQINTDRNYYTTTCQCLVCGATFSVQRRGDSDVYIS